MYLVIDAYNVIHAIPFLEARLQVNLRASRDALISVCVQIQKKRRDISHIIIVFDGASEHRDLDHPEYPGIKVVYTETAEDADDRIVDIMSEYKENEPMVIVSNDHSVLNNAKAFGRKSLSAEMFYQLFKASPEKDKNSVKSASKLSAKEENEITEAYKKIWGVE